MHLGTPTTGCDTEKKTLDATGSLVLGEEERGARFIVRGHVEDYIFCGLAATIRSSTYIAATIEDYIFCGLTATYIFCGLAATVHHLGGHRCFCQSLKIIF